MPTFVVPNAQVLASYFHGLTEAQATELYNAADTAPGSHTADAVLRFAINRNGKTKPGALRIIVSINDSDGSALVWTDDYHPRKDGKAQFDFPTTWVLNDND